MQQVLESEWGFDISQDLKGADGEPNDMLRSVLTHCVYPQCQLFAFSFISLFHIVVTDRYSAVPPVAQ